MSSKKTQPAETDLVTHKKEIIIGAIVATVIIAAVIGIVILVRNSGTPKIVYQPAKACELLTLAEAQELLGDKTLSTSATTPVQAVNTATSKCGYTDGNPDVNNAIVAAIVVRSGINDAGVRQNKTDFVNGKPIKNVETVKDLGDNAYFNEELGQLNVLSGNNWIILSYGLGSTPEANTLDEEVALARKVIN